MIVTATRIRIQGITGLIRFFRLVIKVRQQVDQAEGLVFVKTRGFTTLTGWESLQAMQAFRDTGAHLVAMQNVSRIGSARVVTWESELVPSWDEARSRLA